MKSKKSPEIHTSFLGVITSISYGITIGVVIMDHTIWWAWVLGAVLVILTSVLMRVVTVKEPGGTLFVMEGENEDMITLGLDIQEDIDQMLSDKELRLRIEDRRE